MLEKLSKSLLVAVLLVGSLNVFAADYRIDKEGKHAAINFKIKHLGYSWVTGRFNDFEGSFRYDKNNPAAATIRITINPASVDTNHEKRDKHLRDKEFLDVRKYPDSSFVSTSVKPMGEGVLAITGDFTLRGVVKQITINATVVGEGKDPWGGYRAGFSGTTTIVLADFGINFDLGPASTKVQLELHVEGVRQ